MVASSLARCGRVGNVTGVLFLATPEAAMSAPDEFPAFETIAGNRSRGMLLLGDHAMRKVPAEYGDLGLEKRQFDRHIAYDIGVEALTRALAARLGVSAVMATFSRLLIDANRGEDDPTLIRQIYDGAVIPANYPLSDEERETRLERFHRPYHEAVAAEIEAVASAAGKAPFVVSVHSFTPMMQGRVRPWQVGILWDKDPRAPRALIEMLSADPTLTVGDNEPYKGALMGDTMYRHCSMRGLAHVLIEVRQDLISSDEGVEAWCHRLAPLLEAINARPDIHEVRHFGSRAT